MLPHERENLLFVDVETHEDTLQLLSIQWRYRGEHGIITEFDDESYTAAQIPMGPCKCRGRVERSL